VAKGYAVDRVMDLVREAGCTNAYVDIGGDGAAIGLSPRGQPWRIGIERPRYGALPGEAVATTLPISGRAVATSGDYRQFRRAPDGSVRSHIIDPRTGHPVKHTLASVTAIADTCMEADGLATTLYVLGPEDGMPFVEAQPGVEALFITRTADDGFETTRSSGFPGAQR
jgi:thiamine biosynthesis lipoprotein